MNRLLISIVLILVASAAWSEDARYWVNFSVLKDGQTIEGNARMLVSSKKVMWRKGLRRSYLVLSCAEKKAGPVKIYGTKDIFSGLGIAHHRTGDVLHLTLSRTQVVPREREIRALSAPACQPIEPQILRYEQSFTLDVRHAQKGRVELPEGYAYLFSIVPL